MHNTNLVVLPVVIPFLAGILCFFLRRRVAAQKVIAAVAELSLLGLAGYLLYLVRHQGILILTVGDFPPPFSIVMVADLFAVIMYGLCAILAAACLFFSFYSIDRQMEEHYYYAFYQIQLMGINGAFLTGDIFNLFVFFEILLIASYILMGLGGRPYQLQETFKYMVINMLSSIFFLLAVGVLYSIVGSLNMADLAVKVAQASQKGLLTAVGLVFLVVFGLKGGLFPLYYWLPRSYWAPPAAVAALFGGLLTKVGIYATIRVFTLIFTFDPGFTHTLILAIAGLTMFLGVIGAVSEMDFKRILSYHIISQVGYMVMGLGLFSPLGLAGAIFYIMHHMIVKSCLFLACGATEEVTGTTDLHKMGGVLKTHAGVSWLFLVPALSLAGVPPLSGFFSKFVLVQEGLGQGRYLIVAVSLVVSFLTLFSMLKIFRFVYWGTPPQGSWPQADKRYYKLLLPVASLAGLSVLIGLCPEWFFNLALASARQLMDPAVYVRAVFGG